MSPTKEWRKWKSTRLFRSHSEYLQDIKVLLDQNDMQGLRNFYLSASFLRKLLDDMPQQNEK